MAQQYFADLSSVDREVSPDLILNLIEPKVTQDMNEVQCRAFTEKEISDAMFQMGHLKVLGPDGFPPRFYQKNWLVVKQDVIASVEEFFVNGSLPNGINDTVGIDRRLFCRSTVGSFADQPSTLLPINRRRRTPAMNPGTERRRQCFCAT
jgi:hypothetical protein